MWEGAGGWPLHLLTWVLIMVSVIVITQRINHQRNEKRSAVETARFRCALVAELRALAELYQHNIELIERKAGYLLSGRATVMVYRGNLSRLQAVLDEPVIGRVVEVFARNERIDGMLAGRGNPRAGAAFRFRPDARNLEDFKLIYHETMEEIAALCAALSPQPEAEAPATRESAWPALAPKQAAS